MQHLSQLPPGALIIYGGDRMEEQGTVIGLLSRWESDYAPVKVAAGLELVEVPLSTVIQCFSMCVMTP